MKSSKQASAIVFFDRVLIIGHHIRATTSKKNSGSSSLRQYVLKIMPSNVRRKLFAAGAHQWRPIIPITRPPPRTYTSHRSSVHSRQYYPHNEQLVRPTRLLSTRAARLSTIIHPTQTSSPSPAPFGFEFTSDLWQGRSGHGVGLQHKIWDRRKHSSIGVSVVRYLSSTSRRLVQPLEQKSDTSEKSKQVPRELHDVQDLPHSKSKAPLQENPSNSSVASDGTQRHLLDRLPNMPQIHRPSKEELLAAATGFWSRLKVRFKWFSIRSARPFNADEIGAFFSWVLVGHVLWIVLGTTTFFSLAILAVNTVLAQGTLQPFHPQGGQPNFV